MHEHGPDDLFGPLRGTAAWWRGLGAPLDELDEGPPLKTRSKPRKHPTASAPGVRTTLVERVRAEIAAGTYDTPAKWEAALDRLLDRLDGR